ncbi:hypothetical protein GEMRC1_009183 [Eukaryota sp. GEM-RC1]
MVSSKTAPNIALIKYWGKSDPKTSAPHNDSLSLTLDLNILCSSCTVTSSSHDCFSLNGMSTSISQRLSAQLNLCRSSSSVQTPVSISSTNSFPTAAGLASSASGYAAVAQCLHSFYQLSSVSLSHLARLGSGSACRSVFGGLVHWKSSPPFDSIQILPHSHYVLSNLRCLILVFSGSQKEVPSTLGMSRTMETSPEFLNRKERAHERLSRLIDAFESHDYQTIFDLTMIDSDDLHSMCHSTIPPINYLNASSQKLITAVKSINESFGETIVGYTFDAGPNGFVLFHQNSFKQVISGLSSYYPELAVVDSLDFQSKLNVSDVVEGIYLSKIGGDPLVVHSD